MCEAMRTNHHKPNSCTHAKSALSKCVCERNLGSDHALTTNSNPNLGSDHALTTNPNPNPGDLIMLSPLDPTLRASRGFIRMVGDLI